VATKLIEVALPLDDINAASAREKSIRHGHPSTLHLWWSRKPLATARAVLFAQLVDDPSAHPDRYPTPEAQDERRRELFTIISDLVQWKNTNDETVLRRARAEIAASCGGALPAVMDPFAGGGSIPLEAQRLGLEARASDLNPVAVLINKALVEIPPTFAGRAPVSECELGMSLAHDWPGATGLAADVRHYGEVLRDIAHERVGGLYPTVSIPGDQQATVIAWLWARTVPCPNPACGATMPLLNSFALSRRRNREAWLSPQADAAIGKVRFAVRHGDGCPSQGTVTRRGATCLVCETTVPLSQVRTQAQAGGLGSQLVCVVAEGERGRTYVEATDAQVEASQVPVPEDAPLGSLPHNPRAVTTPNYGLTEWADLFTARQLTTLCAFTEALPEVREQVEREAAAAGYDDDPRRLREGGTGTVAYADAITHYLALAIGRLANRTSSQCFWDAGGEKVQQVFARPALPMIWVYAEGNPFSTSSGNFMGQLDYLVEVMRRLPAAPDGTGTQRDARDRDPATLRAASARRSADESEPFVQPPADTGDQVASAQRDTDETERGLDESQPGTSGVVVCTDPPYYDNIPYADLSDFFYIWLRRCLADVWPDLFGTLKVPKAPELIAEPARHDGWDAAAAFFERGLREAFGSMADAHDERFPWTIFYAFKQSETDASGTASTGWETMLEGLLESGAMIVRTWPIRTEQTYGLREVGRASLASSIILVCRRRPADAPVVSRRDFLMALRHELPDALRGLQQENIAPVDLAQSSIGPGMAVFSRYSRVVEPDGSSMTVRDALAEINRALDAVLEEHEGDLDTDTRWALAWYAQHGHSIGPAGEADTLCKAKNTSIGGLVEAGILWQQGNECRLLQADELDEHWHPTTDKRRTVWETTLHLRRTLMSDGTQAAAALLQAAGTSDDAPRDLAYRLFHICERIGTQSEALAYNALVTAWPDLARQAQSSEATLTFQ